MTLVKMLAVGVSCAALIAPAASAQTPARTGYDETNVIQQLPTQNAAVPLPAGEVLDQVSGGGLEDETSGTGTSPTRPADRPTEPPVTATRESGSAPVKSGTLPFTGLDAGIVAVLGLLLIGTGLTLRRTRSIPSA